MKKLNHFTICDSHRYEVTRIPKEVKGALPLACNP